MLAKCHQKLVQSHLFGSWHTMTIDCNIASPGLAQVLCRITTRLLQISIQFRFLILIAATCLYESTVLCHPAVDNRLRLGSVS